MTTMTTILLFIFNFIAIIVLISLISSKFSSYVINKFTITNSTIEHIKAILIRFNIVVISFDFFLSYISISEGSPTIKLILMCITFIVDGICVICLASYSKVQKKLNN